MGPMGTENVGTCVAGYRICNVDGDGYGPCMGEVQPAPTGEDCATPQDENCDGQINEGCPCTPNTSEPCYSGPGGTENVGPCKLGSHTCNADGMSYGPCIGEVTPQPETCNTPIDDDCNGQTNEGGVGCVCVPNATSSCYTGPGGTQGVGNCKAGTHVCNDQGTAFLPGCSGEVLPAAEQCNVLGDEDCDGVKCSEPIWSESFQSANGARITGDAQGNILLLGSFSGTLTFGATTLVSAGQNDIFLAKLAKNGQPIWAKRFGDAAMQAQTRGLGVDGNGNVVVAVPLAGTIDFGGGGLSAGAGQSGFVVAKLNSSGTHIWSKAFQSSSSLDCAGVAADSAGSVVIAGELSSTVNFGNGALTSAGSTDLFVAKLSGANGTALWSKRFGDANQQLLAAVGVGPSDAIVVVGTHSGTWNLGGPNFTSSGTDVYIARLDSSGNWACSKTIDEGGAPKAIASDSLGGFLIGGGNGVAPADFGGGPLPALGGSDIVLARFSSTCVHAWSKQLGGSNSDQLATLVVDSANNVVLSGNVNGTVDFGGGPQTSVDPDMFIAKFTNAGTHIWSRVIHANSLQGSSATALPTGEIVLTGASTPPTSIDFGLGPVAPGLPVAEFAP
jgi:hypothetical protein